MIDDGQATSTLRPAENKVNPATRGHPNNSHEKLRRQASTEEQQCSPTAGKTYQFSCFQGQHWYVQKIPSLRVANLTRDC